jgi:hypothetical protein
MLPCAGCSQGINILCEQYVMFVPKPEPNQDDAGEILLKEILRWHVGCYRMN